MAKNHVEPGPLIDVFALVRVRRRGLLGINPPTTLARWRVILAIAGTSAFACAGRMRAQATQRPADSVRIASAQRVDTLVHVDTLLVNYSVSRGLEDLERAVTILALLAGGVWTYYRFVRHRTLQPRLETWIDIKEVEGADEKRRLSVTLHIRNVGTSIVALDEATLAIEIQDDARLRSPRAPKPALKTLPKFVVFGDHKAIEPGEELIDAVAYVLDSPPPACVRLGFRLFGPRLKVGNDGKGPSRQWTSHAVVLPQKLVSTDVPSPAKTNPLTEETQ